MDQQFDAKAFEALCIRVAKSIDPKAQAASADDSLNHEPEPEVDVSRYLEGQPDIFAARRMRNATESLIYRLPTELLTSIFLIVLRFSDHALITHHQCAIASGHRRVPEESVFPAIFAMSQVSHYWYQLIANCPSMWTIIDVNSNIQMVRMALERSKEAPVEARMGYRGMLTLDKRKVGLREASMQSCRWVKAHFLGYIEELSYLRFSSVPNLEELYIVPVSASENPGERPTDVFTDLPSLEKLHLGWWPGWDHKHMPNLRHLMICEAGPPRATLSEIFRMLEGCPLLEFLEISVEVEIGNDMAGPLPIVPTVELPNLQRLDLIGWPVVEMDLFFRAVSLPSCNIFNLKGGYNPIEISLDSYYRSLESRLAPYVRSLVDQSTAVEVLFAGHFVRLVFEGESGEKRAPEQKGVVELGRFHWAQVMEWIANEFPTFNDMCTVVSFGDENLGAHFMQMTQVEEVFPWMLKLHNLETVRFLPKAVLLDRVLAFLYGVMFPQFDNRESNPWEKLKHLIVMGCQCRYADGMARILEFAAQKLFGEGRDVAMIHPSYLLVPIGDECDQCSTSMQMLVHAGEVWNHSVEIPSLAMMTPVGQI